MKEHKYSIAVDFDGVVHSYRSPFTENAAIDPPTTGAIEWLTLMAQHFNIIIHTTRGKNAEGQYLVRRYLLDHGLSGEIVDWLDVTNVKHPALIYLDDRALRFNGPLSWPTVQEIHQALPWNKIDGARPSKHRDYPSTYIARLERDKAALTKDFNELLDAALDFLNNNKSSDVITEFAQRYRK